MNDESVFRWTLLAGLVVFLPPAVSYRFKSRTGERLDRRQEGLFILVTLRLAGLAAMAGFLAYLVNPASMAWAAVRLPAPVRWVGVGLGLIAGGLLVWTLRSLGRNLTDTVVTRRKHTLVTTGPYRWVRHPFYSAAALAFLGNSLAMASWFLFLAGSTVLLLLVVRTRKEEANLIARFGDEYRIYLQKTGRFVPRMRGLAGSTGNPAD